MALSIASFYGRSKTDVFPLFVATDVLLAYKSISMAVLPNSVARNVLSNFASNRFSIEANAFHLTSLLFEISTSVSCTEVKIDGCSGVRVIDNRVKKMTLSGDVGVERLCEYVSGPPGLIVSVNKYNELCRYCSATSKL